jgi:predicted TIM-barrel fold metal-dependent hydrolase
VTGVVDCAFHPLAANTDDVLQYLDHPWKGRGIAYGFQKGAYHPPIPRFAPDAQQPDGVGLPASDPDYVTEHYLEPAGIEFAILIPLTFGLVPEVRFESALVAATNRWLMEHWLDADANHGQFKGSIRVNVRDVRGALAEIERWADHPQVVQVTVPLEAHVPYGQEMYFPIWESAAAHGLPVAFHSDGWAGAQLPPTGAGYPSYFIEVHVQQPLLSLVHLGSMVVEGVLDRLPDLKLVLADGAFALVEPVMWRVDRAWRSLRFETPWIETLPSGYVHDHVRIVLHKADLPADRQQTTTLLEALGVPNMLMYGSNYPFWDLLDVPSATAVLPEETLDDILRGNAMALYGHRVAAA